MPSPPSLVGCGFMPCHFTGISVLKHKGWGVNYSLFVGSANLYTSKPCLNIETHIARILLPNSFWCGLQQWYGVKIYLGIVYSAVKSLVRVKQPKSTLRNNGGSKEEFWLKLRALLGDQKLIKNNLSLTWSLHSSLPPAPTPHLQGVWVEERLLWNRGNWWWFFPVYFLAHSE